MTDHTLDQLLQSCWDEGRDPVDDAGVQEHLLAHPERLEDFAQWRSAVRALPGQRRARRLRGRWIAAAAGVVVALAGWWSFRGRASAETGAVLSSTFETTTEEPGVTVSWRERRPLVTTPRTQFTITEHRSAIR